MPVVLKKQERKSCGLYRDLMCILYRDLQFEKEKISFMKDNGQQKSCLSSNNNDLRKQILVKNDDAKNVFTYDYICQRR